MPPQQSWGLQSGNGIQALASVGGCLTFVYGLPPQVETDRYLAKRKSLAVDIRHLEWELCVRAEMEICNTVVPIVANGRQAAGKVIGIVRCGRDPGSHDGR
jgi:hypothetical protein